MKKHAKAMFAGQISLSVMASSDFRKIDPHGAQAFDLAMDDLAEFDISEAGDRSRRHQLSGLEAAAMITDTPGKGAKNIERVAARNRNSPVKDRLACDLKFGADPRKIHALPIAHCLPTHKSGIDLVVGKFPQRMGRLVIGEPRINHLDRGQRRHATTSPAGKVGVGRIRQHTINPESQFEFDADQSEFGPGEPRRTAADPISRDWRHDGRFIGRVAAGLEGSDGFEGTDDGFLNPICSGKVNNRVFQVGAGQLPAALMCGAQEFDNDGFGRTISHNIISPRLYRQACDPVEPVSYLWQIYRCFGTALERISALAKLKAWRVVDSTKISGPPGASRCLPDARHRAAHRSFPDEPV